MGEGKAGSNRWAPERHRRLRYANIKSRRGKNASGCWKKGKDCELKRLRKKTFNVSAGEEVLRAEAEEELLPVQTEKRGFGKSLGQVSRS